MNYFKDYWISDNWEHSKVESVFEFWGVDDKTLYDGGFQFCQTGSYILGSHRYGAFS